jgi:hypothetical protein
MIFSPIKQGLYESLFFSKYFSQNAKKSPQKNHCSQFMIMPFSRRTDMKGGCSLHGDHSIPDCTRWWLLFPTIPRSLASEKKGILCITSVACAVGPSVATSSTDFSFQNLFFGIYLNFQQQKPL